MIERKSELKRRYHRKKKLAKLKAKLAKTKDGRDKENILRKLHLISPLVLAAVTKAMPKETSPTKSAPMPAGKK